MSASWSDDLRRRCSIGKNRPMEGTTAFVVRGCVVHCCRRAPACARRSVMLAVQLALGTRANGLARTIDADLSTPLLDISESMPQNG